MAAPAPAPTSATPPAGAAHRPGASPGQRAAPVPALPRAQVGVRLLGYVVDLALVAVGAAIGLLLGSPVLAVVLAAEIALVTVVVEARRGVTLGKLLTGTRATTAGADVAPGLRRESVRAGLLGAGHLVAGLGQIALIASGGRQRAWHDRVAGTDVVTLRPSRTAGSRVHPGSGAVHHVSQQAPGHPGGPGVPGWPPSGPAGTPAAAGVQAGPSAPGTGVWSAAGAPPAEGWRPPELLHVPPSEDSVSIREFRRMQQQQRPVVPPRPSVQPTAPPRQPAAAVPPVPPQRPAAATPPVPSQQPVVSAVPAPREPTAVGEDRTVVQAVELTVRDGDTHRIAGSAVLGRKPSSDDPAAQVVVIRDVARSLSRTHARVLVREGAAWVEDAGSANGTRLVQPDGSTVRLVPGAPVRLRAGAVLLLGQTALDVRLS